MRKITSAKIDKSGRAVLIEALDEHTEKTSQIILSADFVFMAKDDLAAEFADFMKQKGYDVRNN